MDVKKKTDSVKRAGFLPGGVLWLLCLLPLGVTAETERIVVVADEQNPVHQRFIAAFRLHLTNMTVVEVAQDNVGSEMLKGASLVVSLGTKAARVLSGKNLDAQVINSLITESDWRRLDDATGELHRHAALFLDQPPSRQLALVRTAMPGYQSLTVVLGPTSERARSDIEQGCIEQALRCEVMRISGEAEIELVLNRAAADGKVLLVLPDPQVVNATTARNLILGAFRRNVALVGYSQALVKAGALMAVHSTPEQLGGDTAEMARIVLEQGERLSAGYYPSHFSVSVNYQLARALRLDLAAEVLLERTLHRAE